MNGNGKLTVHGRYKKLKGKKGQHTGPTALVCSPQHFRGPAMSHDDDDDRPRSSGLPVWAMTAAGLASVMVVSGLVAVAVGYTLASREQVAEARARFEAAGAEKTAISDPLDDDGQNPLLKRRAVAGKELVTLNGITAEVTGWKVERPKKLVGGKPEEVKDEFLVVRLRFSTTDPTVSRKRYGFGVLFRLVKAVDDFGNRVEASALPPVELLGGEPHKEMRVGKPAESVLLLAVPLPTAERIDLDIPGDVVNLNGQFFRFTLPLKGKSP